MNTDTPELYELPEHWENEPRGESPTFIQKARIINAMIPDTAARVLDVGCGDGALTHLLDKSRHQIIALDRSHQALKYVKTSRVRASCDRLPFPDKSFDIVVCSEVLEHLPTGVFEKTVAEIQRVAISHIIISVPFRDNLRLRMCRCADCGFEYNAWGHCRTFNAAEDLARRFRSFKLDATTFCGLKFKPMPWWLLFLGYYVGGKRAQNPIAICPSCHSQKKDPRDRKWITYFTDRIYWRMPIKTQTFWIVCLFKRPDLVEML